MAELSEKLGLEPAGGVVYEVLLEDHNASLVRANEAVEEDRVATVEAVARWLRERHRMGRIETEAAFLIESELLSRPEPEGGRGEGGQDG